MAKVTVPPLALLLTDALRYDPCTLFRDRSPYQSQGLELSAADIQVQLSRRRPGQSNLTTPARFQSHLPLPLLTFHSQRDEKDLVHVQSGIEHGVTLGTPIGLLVKNEDQRPKDYSETDLYPRPSHADYTYLEKYGIKASSGGGRSSARETIGKLGPPLSPSPSLTAWCAQDALQPVQSLKST